MSNQEIERSIEAILMVVDEPVSEVILAQIIEAPTEQILESLHHLQNRYENEFRGFQLRQVSGGWRFYSHPDLAPLVEKFVLDGQQAKLT
ncbi:MAG: SMC-Scp complex subunit ScpB, partial [Actinobacteria bacterium]|nr:SMC-Scp complex subunit ScpB [Actinomycetota bacterium]